MGYFSGKVGLVTGAGSGLGRAIAVELARAGADVVAVDLDAERLERTASVAGASGRKCMTACANVALLGEMETLAERVLGEMGRVDILVNNAGIAVGGELCDVSFEDFDRIVGVNLMGEVYGTRLFLPGMIERGQGHVVNVSSLSGLVPLPYHMPYTTTKYGLTGFSEVLATEVRDYGVRVTLVCPGAMKTNIMEDARIPAPRGLGQEKFERFIERIFENGMPPDEAARKVLAAVEKGKFLCLVGREAYLLYYFHRLAPGAMRRMVAFVTERSRRM